MIGIFDSGIGGLSVFREIRNLLPEQDYLYYSDNAHCPYGEKSKEYIIDRARAITDFLLSKGAEIIVVACNTATAAAISTLRAEYPHIPFIGMEPAIKPAVKITRSGIVGVLATAGTLKADKYIDTRGKWSDSIRVAEHVGLGFVELVEAGSTTGPKAEETVQKSLKPLLDEGADVIVLGCTHYPFLSDTIMKVATELHPGKEIQVIDPAPAVAKHIVEVMQEKGIPQKGSSTIKLYASGDDDCLRKTYENL